MSPRLGSRGDWQEFDPAAVKEAIRENAGKPKLKPIERAAVSAVEVFQNVKSEAISIFDTELDGRPDSFLAKLKSDLEQLEPASEQGLLQLWAPSGQIMSRDTMALGQGYKPPPHLEVLAEVTSLRLAFQICQHAAGICQKAASHLERKSRNKKRNALVLLSQKVASDD
jgi:hypothetical protein